VRHVSLVERGARNRNTVQSAVLRQGQQFQFDLHGEEQHLVLGSELLSALGEVGKDLIKGKENCSMSLMGFAEKAIKYGTVWGLVSDKIGLTGRGGLIHDGDNDPENQAILVDDDGLFFIENQIQVGWDDVVEIVDEGDRVFRFELRGGLIVFSGRISGDIDSYVDSPLCTDMDVADLEYEGSAENIEALRVGVDNLFWAIEIAKQIRGASHIVINEDYLLKRIVFGYAKAWMLSMKDGVEDVQDDISRILVSKGRDWQDAISEQAKNLELDDVDDVDDDTSSLIGWAFFWSHGWPMGNTGDGVEMQKKMYDVLRSARAWGFDGADGEIITILTSDEDADVPMGDKQWSNHRKMIICTDAKASVSTMSDGLKMPDVMVMDAHDILSYNEGVEDGLKLRFESNHPQNGVAYIQHPTLNNTYLSLDTYHFAMLERKYDELKHLLTCLGATSLELSAESASSNDTKTSSKRKVGASVDVDMMGGASASFSNSSRAARMTALCKTLRTKRILTPNGKPYVPNDVEFYPTEQGWQRLAKLALTGRIKSEEVSLTYRNESAISGSTLRSISAKLQSKVPGYSFGAEGDYEDEYESELKTLESLAWSYKVEFGGIDLATQDDPSAENKKSGKPDAEVSNGVENKAEQLFLKRAKRYAQSEGHINADQRVDLEAFAKKYGIDDFRMEELIEEAFE